MNEPGVIPEPISKSIFESYIEFVEKRKIQFGYVFELEKNYLFLEKLVLLFERYIQDIDDNRRFSDKQKKEISESIVDFLEGWIFFVRCIEDDEFKLDCLNYNFYVALSEVQNITIGNYVFVLRHLMKLGSKINNSFYVKELHSIIRSKDFATITDRPFLQYMQIHSDLKRTAMQLLNVSTLDPNAMNVHVRSELQDFLMSEINPRFYDNYFSIADFDSLKELDIDELRDGLSKRDFFELVERLFEFDDEIHNVIWDVDIKLEDDVYDAGEIGYLILSLSKAFESIDDIEVELLEWGEGSKWVKFRVKIKSLASKVDLMQVLKTSRQALESVYHKKPFDEIKKFEAESNKINAEADKIKKETASMLNDSQSELQNELSLHNQFLELQKKEVEIESMKADVRLKNIEALTKISDVLEKGIIQNNSQIQILINQCVYIERKNNEIVKADPIEFFEANETIENKEIPYSSPHGPV